MAQMLMHLTKDGDTPLILASRQGDSDIINLLIKNGADINMSNKYGSTPLHNVCSHKYDYDIINLLIKNGAGVNVVDKNGSTPLHFYM